MYKNTLGQQRSGTGGSKWEENSPVELPDFVVWVCSQEHTEPWEQWLTVAPPLPIIAA